MAVRKRNWSSVRVPPGEPCACPRCGSDVYRVTFAPSPDSRPNRGKGTGCGGANPARLLLERRPVAGLALRDLSPVAVYPFHPESCAS